jgi:hypothetical protein
MLESLAIQNLIVAAIVLFAAALLAVRASKYFLPGKAHSGCASGCGTCPSNPTLKTVQPKLLQLGDRSRPE